jgi:dipeptidyl aminopeptidase/acylaminoacyl peptidase
MDRQGRASPLPGVPPDSYRDVRMSPDGGRLALATPTDVWTYDVVRATRSRLTTDPAPDRSPLWTPDGQRVIFTSTRAGYPELLWRSADGAGGDQRLLARAKDLIDLRADGWSADGKQLLLTEVPPNFQCAIGQMTIERPSDVKVLVKSEFCNDFPAVSPDGRWIYYDAITGLMRMPAAGGDAPADPLRPAVRRPVNLSLEPGSGALIVGGILVVVGAWALASQYLPAIPWSRVWPLGLVVAGLVIVIASFSRRR